MNKICSKVWNKSLGQLVVASELAARNGKAGTRRVGEGCGRSGIAASTAMAAAMAVAIATAWSPASLASTIATDGGSACGAVGTTAIGPDGVARTTIAQTDGSGNLSLVAGCYAQGGGYLGVTVYGAFSQVTGAGGTAFGYAAQAGEGAASLGMAANASGQTSVAVGARSTADGTGAIAIGKDSASHGVNSFAAGAGAIATEVGDTAIGESAVTFTGGGNTALGRGANAGGAGGNNTAVGNNASASAIAAAALGDDSYAYGDVSVALGAHAQAGVEGGVALGAYSIASTVAGAAGYVPAAAGIAQAAAINATTSTMGAVSVGDAATAQFRQITGVAAGTADSDAVNVAQLKALGDVVDTGAVHYVSINDNGVQGGNYANDGATGLNATAIGVGARAFGESSIAQGDSATAYGIGDIAIGGGAVSSGESDIGGSLIHAPALAIGYGATTGGAGALALGTSSNANAFMGVAIGYAASAGNSNDVALGSNSVTAAAVGTSGVTIGGTTYTFAGTSPTSTVSIGTAGAERTITNVAAGRVSGTSTDAVNGSQLFATSQAIEAIDGNVAELGDRTVKYDGAVGDPKDTITLEGVAGTTLTNLADGDVSATSTDAVNGSQLYETNQDVAQNATDITNLGNQATTIYDTGTKYFHANSTGTDSNPVGTDSVAIGQSAVANNANDVALGAGAVTAAAVGTANAVIDGVTYAFAGVAPTSTLSIGAAGQERTLTNLAAGRLVAGSTDAVNGSQLYAAMQAINLIGTQVDAISGGATGMFQVSADRTTPAPAPTGTNSAAGGAGATAAGNGSLAVGNDSSAAGNQSVALGNDATASGAGSAAVGQGAIATADGSVAIGQGAADGGRGAESYTGKYSGAANNTVGTVSVGNATTGETRTIGNVADGREATDAVNLRQLDGAVQAANDYTDTQITKVAGAAAGISNGSTGMFQVSADANTEQPQATGAKSTAGGNGAVASADGSTAIGNGAQATGANSVALGQGSVADRADSVSVGSAGNERRVTNVAAGTATTDAVNVGQLEAAQAGTVQYDRNADGSADYASVTMNVGGDPTVVHNVGAGTATTDAVNVGQLDSGVQKAMDWSKSYTDQRFQSFDRNLNTIGNRANAGIASSMAMASLPQAYAPNQSSAAVALGNFHGETGIAVGVSTVTESGRYVLKLNATSNTRGDAGVGVGAAVVW